MELADFVKDKKNFFYPKENHKFINFEEAITEIGKSLGMAEGEIDKRLRNFVPPKNRLREKKIRENLAIIEDDYNSNPLGFEKALTVLAGYKKWQRIVVTAGMIELGEKQFELNCKLGEEAAKVADMVVVVGETNKDALLAGANKVKGGKRQIVWWPKDKNTDPEISSLFRPPTVILKENDFLPDNYF